jgi:peptidoglycan L-alanyl-D-glutamate endopeptidase CwlK
MPQFSKESLDKLATCRPELRLLFTEVIKHVDCTILYGRRGKAEQDKAVAAGHSKTKWPFSKHNCPDPLDPQKEDPNGLSRAVDAGPYPILWPEHEPDPKKRVLILARWYAFMGFVKGVAAMQGVRLRFGFDWDGDFDFTDQTFHDLPHAELVE